MFMEKSVFKMYVKTGCPFCEKAREIILKDLKSGLHLVDVTHQPDLRQMVIAETGQKTVPAIYIGEQFIGGFSELQKLDEEGKLDPMLLKEEVKVLRIENARLRRGL